MRPSATAGALSATVAALLAAAGAQAQTGQPSGMGNMPGLSGSPSPDGADAQTSPTGTVTGVDAAQRKVTLDHEPIPAIGWPAMKIELSAALSVDLLKIEPGTKVQFTLSRTGPSYTVQSITPTP